jgi:hypothetical protein
MVHPVDLNLHTHVGPLVTSWCCWVVASDSAAVASFSMQIAMHGGYLVSLFVLGGGGLLPFFKYFFCMNKALITLNPIIKYN